MQAIARIAIAMVSAAWATASFAQSIVLDPASASLPGIPAGPGDVLVPAAPPGPGPRPTPVVGLSAAALGLLPDDVVDAISFLDDFAGGPIHFSVDRASVAGAALLTPDVPSEAVTTAPMATQGEVAADQVVTNDGSCVPPSVHAQVPDGNRLPLGLSVGYPGLNIAGPLAPADDIAVRLEIESGGNGVRFAGTLATCTSKSSKDLCAL